MRPEGQLRSLLGIFQFSGEAVFKKVEVLSGGEKNRLALARLTLDPGNFLLLDEPTNHLDLPTREALEDALAGFGGTLLFVSHDRYFINKVATRVAAFRDGRLRLYDGGYDDFLAASARGEPAAGRRPAARSAPGGRGGEPGGGAGRAPSDRDATPERESAAVKEERTRSASPATPSMMPRNAAARRRVEAEARNRRNRDLRFYRNRVAEIESGIEPLEARLKEIETAMSSSETYKEPGLARSLGEEKKSIEIELAHLYDQWEEATADLQREEA
jgi:ATP-binding cassette subfamily F protein 3